MQSIRVLVLDPQRAVGTALAAALSSEPDLTVVDVTESVQGVRRPSGRRFDVLLIDLAAVGSAGLDLVRSACRRPDGYRVVVISDATTSALAIAAARAGVSAWVPKRLGLRHLVWVIRSVTAGEGWFPPALLGPILADLADPQPSTDQQKIENLTCREREVLARLAEGLDRRTIARRLCLSLNTVRTHIQNILGKLEVHSELEAASIMLRAEQSNGGGSHVGEPYVGQPRAGKSRAEASRAAPDDSSCYSVSGS